MRRKATGATNKSRRFSGEYSPEGWTDSKFYIFLYFLFGENSDNLKVNLRYSSNLLRKSCLQPERHLTKAARFSGRGTFFFENFRIKFAGYLFLVLYFLLINPLKIVMLELARMENGGKRNFTTAKHPLLELFAAKNEKTGREMWYICEEKLRNYSTALLSDA